MPGLLIRSAILDGAAELIRAHGARPGPIARNAGIPRSALTDPDLPVNANSVLRFFELAADACRLPTWGLTLARAGRLAAILGPLWVLLRNARTIGEMCSELADNFDLYSDSALVTLERTEGGLYLNWSVTTAQAQSEVQMSEYAMSLFASEIRSHLTRDWMPRAVLFRHAAPGGSLRLYRTAFGADVRFNQGRNALLLDTRTLEAPLRGRGASGRALADRLVHLEEHPAEQSIARRVEAIIRALMPYAPCGVKDVGHALQMAPRTLQLRLKKADAPSFVEIRDAVRSDLASKYLRHSKLSVVQIAEILGYADSTSLSRSFRKWHGRSLREVRRQR